MKPDPKLAALLAGGHQFDRESALAGGLTDHELSAYLHSGVLTAPFKGVYRVAGADEDDWDIGMRARLLAAGPLAVAGMRAARQIHELTNDTTAPFEIIGPIAKHVRPKDTIIHRSTRLVPELVTVRNSMKVTTVGWTLCTLGTVVPDIVVEKSLEVAIRTGKVTLAGIEHLMKTYGGRGVRGIATMRRVLAKRPDGPAARSAFEVDLLDCIRRAGLPMPDREFMVKLPNGTETSVDLGYRAQHVAIFGEGDEFHYTRQQREWDREVMNWLQELGWEVLRYGYWDPKKRPTYVTNRIRHAIAG